LFECLGEIPSLSHILWYLPAAKKMRRLEKYAMDRITRFQENKDKIELDFKPLASYLIDNDEVSTSDVHADSLFAIQAGSDTPSGVATLLVFFILSNPDAKDKLVEELRGAITKPHFDMSLEKLQKLPYLTAVIYEGLRLGTPFGGFPRVVPTGGVLINERFIPEGTIVSIPTYTQEISERNFSPHPLVFKPERWLETTGVDIAFKTNHSALMAFSSGPYGCLGKDLAWNQLLMFTAQLFFYI